MWYELYEPMYYYCCCITLPQQDYRNPDFYQYCPYTRLTGCANEHMSISMFIPNFIYKNSTLFKSILDGMDAMKHKRECECWKKAVIKLKSGVEKIIYTCPLCGCSMDKEGQIDHCAAMHPDPYMVYLKLAIVLCRN